MGPWNSSEQGLLKGAFSCEKLQRVCDESHANEHTPYRSFYSNPLLHSIRYCWTLNFLNSWLEHDSAELGEWWGLNRTTHFTPMSDHGSAWSSWIDESVGIQNREYINIQQFNVFGDFGIHSIIVHQLNFRSVNFSERRQINWPVQWSKQPHERQATLSRGFLHPAILLALLNSLHSACQSELNLRFLMGKPISSSIIILLWIHCSRTDGKIPLLRNMESLRKEGMNSERRWSERKNVKGKEHPSWMVCNADRLIPMIFWKKKIHSVRKEKSFEENLLEM